MKCEKHNTEMRWHGDMLTGGPVCARCNHEKSIRAPNVLTEALVRRQTGRTTDALRRMVNYCEFTQESAVYIVHNDRHMSYCLDILESLGCKRVPGNSVKTPCGATISVRSLDNPNVIRGAATEVDHFVWEEEQFRERLMRMPELWGRKAVPPLPPGDGVS